MRAIVLSEMALGRPLAGGHGGFGGAEWPMGRGAVLAPAGAWSLQLCLGLVPRILGELSPLGPAPADVVLVSAEARRQLAGERRLLFARNP